MRTSTAKSELSNLRCKAQTFALKLTETENKHAIRQNLMHNVRVHVHSVCWSNFLMTKS